MVCSPAPLRGRRSIMTPARYGPGGDERTSVDDVPGLLTVRVNYGPVMLAHPMIVRVAGGNPGVTRSGPSRSTRCGCRRGRCGASLASAVAARAAASSATRTPGTTRARSRSGSLPGRRTRRGARRRAYARLRRPETGQGTPCRRGFTGAHELRALFSQARTTALHRRTRQGHSRLRKGPARSSRAGRRNGCAVVPGW